MRTWWGRLSLRARLAGAFGLMAAGALAFLLAVVARTLGPEHLSEGKILPTAFFAVAAFFLGGWFVAGWCLAEVSRLGGRVHQKTPGPLPAELEGLAALLRREGQKRDRLLGELRRFTADASHELRTPLTALRMVGEIALRDTHADGCKLRDTIGSMLEESGRMNALIERLLRLARVESEELLVKPRTFALANHLSALCGSLAVLAEEKEVHLQIVCEPPDLRATTDLTLLGHTILNLLHNAIRHSPPGGHVTVRATVGILAENTVPSQEIIVIEVTDQGPGIASEHHARLFERFYRVDTARDLAEGGFGLGLCIAKVSAERVGGTVSVESVLGAGATFRLVLPAHWM